MHIVLVVNKRFYAQSKYSYFENKDNIRIPKSKANFFLL